MIWSNPRFSKSVSTNVAKAFFQMVTKHFPGSHKLHKIFHRNTVQVSYNCMNNMSKIIKGHHKKVISKPSEQQPKCNWRKKLGCPMKGNCQVNDVVYKCDVTRPLPKKVYFGTEEGEWKNRFYCLKLLFEQKRYSNNTTLSSYIWHLKSVSSETPSLKWSVLRSIPPY